MANFDVSDPFTTLSQEHPDFNDLDALGETRRLAQRQEAIEAHLKGEESIDYVCDVLNDQGISPDQYLSEVVEAMEYVIDNGIVFQSNELGLFLPAGLIV